MDKITTIEFIKNHAKREGLCKNHVYSQYVFDNWDKIATEGYIRTKAENLNRLLGLKITEPSDEWQVLTGLVYHTGDEIREAKDRAEGWGYFDADKFQEGQAVELRTDSILGYAYHIGKIIKDREGHFFFLPKGKRSRGYYLIGKKIRAIK